MLWLPGSDCGLDGPTLHFEQPSVFFQPPPASQVYGEACVWCGGGLCTTADQSTCGAFDFLMKPGRNRISCHRDVLLKARALLNVTRDDQEWRGRGL